MMVVRMGRRMVGRMGRWWVMLVVMMAETRAAMMA